MPVSKELVRIGINEFIELPDYDRHSIPAKVDTGADGSAIWASDVQLQADTLSFKLFGSGSELYTGETVQTTIFRTIKVKNSFGQTEFRYKVQLNIKIGQRRIKSWFTLAARGHNTYPVLLGKRLLKNRYLVDVSSTYLLSADKKATQNVLVLSAMIGKQLDSFFADTEKVLRGKVHFDVEYYRDLVFSFDKKPSVLSGFGGHELDDYRLVYFKNYKIYTEQAAAVGVYLQYKSIKFHDQEIGNTVSLSKLTEMMRLNCAHLPLPKSYATTSRSFKGNFSYLEAQLGTPFVLKDCFADRGKSNYLIKKESDFERIIGDATKSQYFVAQKYILNDGFYRVLVLGNEPALIIKRASIDAKTGGLKQHLNKPKGGSNAELIEAVNFDSGTLSLAVTAASVMKRQVAGVDLIQDINTNDWYILEVNYNPHMIDGSFRTEKISVFANYIQEEIER